MHNVLRTSLRVLLVALVAASVGCDKDEAWQDPGPRDVFDAFLMDWFRGDTEKAFQYILPADRETLTAALEDVKDLSEEQRPKPHEMLVVAAVDNVYDISKMEVVESIDEEPAEGQTVTVKMHHQDGSTAEAQLVWSEGRWFVDLPLKEAES